MTIYVALDGEGFSVYQYRANQPSRLAGPFDNSAAAWRAADSFARVRIAHRVRRPMALDLAERLYTKGLLLSPIARDTWEAVE